jgi:hypothetical protein
LDEILDGKIGPTPEQKDLDATYTEGKRRYEENCPPGYLDASKAKSSDSVYTSNGLRIERQYGDLLVWKQIVTTAAERQIKDLIFVTDDEKEDWWWVVESKGKKTIGPRPELIEEIQRDAGVSTFYMYSSERFIQYAKDYLGIAVNPESIEQIRDASQDKKTIRQLGAEIAVLEWLARIHAQNRLEEPGGFPEFVVTLPDGSRLGYEVMLLPLQKSIIEELSQRRPADLKRLYVVQVSDRTPLGFVDDYLALPAGVSVVLGHLEYPSGESNPVFVPDREFPPVPGVSPPAG